MLEKFILRLLRLLEALTGALLSGVSVSLQLANIFICFLLLLAGPAFVLVPLAK